MLDVLALASILCVLSAIDVDHRVDSRVYRSLGKTHTGTRNKYQKKKKKRINNKKRKEINDPLSACVGLVFSSSFFCWFFLSSVLVSFTLLGNNLSAAAAAAACVYLYPHTHTHTHRVIAAVGSPFAGFM
jgi:hypothetical protein